MNINRSEAELEGEFLARALKRSELLRLAEPESANREFDGIENIRLQMRHLPDKGKAAFTRIASTTSDPDVQILAATALLPLDETRAIDLLSRIATDDGAGIPSFTVEMTLREWRAGG